MKIITTDDAPKAIGPYSQAVLASGQMLFISGQIPLNPLSMTIDAVHVKEQTHQVLKNMEAILNASNASFQNVVKTTVFLKNMEDFATVNEVYAEYFKEPKPARVCLAVKELPKGALVEIDAIAVI